MSAIVCEVGEQYLLDKANSFSPGDNWKLALYQNNHAPTRTSVLGDFTLCTFAGYADLSIGSWAASTIDGSQRAVANPSSNSFVYTRSSTGTAQTAFGYLVYEGTTLIFAELFPSSFTFTNAGDQLTLTLQDRLASDT